MDTAYFNKLIDGTAEHGENDDNLPDLGKDEKGRALVLVLDNALSTYELLKDYRRKKTGVVSITKNSKKHFPRKMMKK